MTTARDVVRDDIIQDLWSAGFTILPRRRHPDPFFVPPEIVPHGRSYQWWHLVHDKFHFHRDGGNSTGWSPVPASRHDGYFMPAGHVGDIEVSGLGLFEKSKVEVDQERDAQRVAAQKPLLDWQERAKEFFSGGVTVGDTKTDVGEQPDVFKTKSKTIETTSRIPKDMIPHMAAIFEERDRLRAEMVLPDRSLKPGPIADKFYAEVDERPAAPWWPTLLAILLPIAIENVRKGLKGEK